jgi:hypothetical protein
VACRVLSRELAGQRLHAGADRIEPQRQIAGGVLACLIQRGPVMVDRRQHRRGLCVEAGTGGIDRLRRPLHGRVDRSGHSGRGFAHARRSRRGAAVDARDMRRQALRSPSEHLVGFAAACRQGGELCLQAARLAVGGEPRFLHRLRHRARLLLRSGQIVEQDADIDPRRRGSRVERRRLAIEIRRLLREIIGHPPKPVRRLVPERHQPFRLAAQARMVFLDPRRDDGEHAFQRIALRPHLPDGAGETLRLAPGRPPEPQPEQGKQGERRTRRRGPGNQGGKVEPGPGGPQRPAGGGDPCDCEQGKQCSEQTDPQGARLSGDFSFGSRILQPGRRRAKPVGPRRLVLLEAVVRLLARSFCPRHRVCLPSFRRVGSWDRYGALTMGR